MSKSSSTDSLNKEPKKKEMKGSSEALNKPEKKPAKPRESLSRLSNREPISLRPHAAKAREPKEITREQTQTKRDSIKKREPIKKEPVKKGGLVGKPKINLVEEYTKLLNSKNQTDRDLRISLKQIRLLILKHGIPTQLRASIWKILLGIYKIDALEYINLVNKGPSSYSDKIENDTFRTFSTDKSFTDQVSLAMLTRILNACVWKLEEHKSRFMTLSFTYVQAPFIYVMPELDAFYTFSTFIQHTCPLYVQPALEGVHLGVKMFDKLLYELDVELFNHLSSTPSTVYCFPWVMTFGACWKPLTEVLKLWDFYLAYGIHLNILAIIVILQDQRKELLSTKKFKIQVELNAEQVIKGIMGIVNKCPEDLYDLLCRHTYDPSCFDSIE
ncbi:hypothetical protein HK103_005593 [Boothiomyces macroporosus]|uniref:Rab-GAP TBC domain-containing protein n=1 Tax=Boothiomyces macroporosus TaxID=261099 RepID=A0AAD5UF38_9FUNG|nr:hypothetical protein HK103_005593 [Boothiomyces macroporosus]